MAAQPIHLLPGGRLEGDWSPERADLGVPYWRILACRWTSALSSSSMGWSADGAGQFCVWERGWCAILAGAGQQTTSCSTWRPLRGGRIGSSCLTESIAMRWQVSIGAITAQSNLNTWPMCCRERSSTTYTSEVVFNIHVRLEDPHKGRAPDAKYRGGRRHIDVLKAC